MHFASSHLAAEHMWRSLMVAALPLPSSFVIMFLPQSNKVTIADCANRRRMCAKVLLLAAGAA